jgi:hypothetical protein
MLIMYPDDVRTGTAVVFTVSENATGDGDPNPISSAQVSLSLFSDT